MTPLKAGAIALMLIITIPIMLGYAMATEDVEETVEISENTGNITDLTLNSTTPYYIPYAGANNNQSLYITSDNYSAITNPDYVSTSSTTYSFTPVYVADSGTYPLASAETVTYSTNTTITNSEIPSFYTAKITINDGGASCGVHTLGLGMGFFDFVSGDSFYIISFEEDGTTYYRMTGFDVLDDVDISEYVVDYFEISNATMEYMDTYTVLNNIEVDPWAIAIDGIMALKLTYSDATTYEISTLNAEGLAYTGSTLTVTIDGGNTVYSDVSVVSIALSPDVTTVHYTTTGSTTISAYADVSEGWHIHSPSSTINYYTHTWFNNFENYSIRMMVHIEAGESFSIFDSSSFQFILDSDSNGVVTAYFGGGYETLGVYTDIMIDLGVRDSTTKYSTVVVSGLADWPTFGEIPETVYNSVTLQSTFSFVEPFETLELGGSETVEIRVDSTNIIGGYFPSTSDYIYRPFSLFPNDDRQSIVIDSIGIYGDGLNFNGASYSLSDDNTITFTDADTSETVTASVLGLVVKFVENDDGDAWTTYINDHLLSETASAPYMAFEGEWSLTLHRTVSSTETVIQSEWVPGEFALDENGFVMVMLLVALAAFVGLGMTGGRSGAKVGILALICGGAVMVGLTIL